MHLCRFVFPVCLMASWIPSFTVFGQESGALKPLKSSLSFYASFDKGMNAEVARGDASLWHAPRLDDRKGAEEGLPPGMEVQWLPEQGRFGGGVQFSESRGPMVFYRASKNFPELKPGWSATVMFWLKTDPVGLLKEGFCDPFQVTSKQWDDAAIFVEFEKRSTGIPFRLGVYADKPVWNPTNRKFEDIPPAERPLGSVNQPPFAKDKWVHVAFTVSQFNTGKQDGVAELYFDGKPVAKISPRNQMFTWDADQAAIMIGLGYIGSMDELAIFDRALSPAEIQTVHQLPEGINALTR